MAKQKTKRPYTKRDTEYWNNLSKSKKSDYYEESSASKRMVTVPLSSSLGSDTGVYSSGRGTSNKSRRNHVGTARQPNELANISRISIPYEANGNYINIHRAIDLTERAYVGFSLFRNTIDIMTEFSAANIYLTEGNKSSKRFIENWFKRIDVNRLAEQFFREYFRSGNVFVYKFDGKFSESDLKKLRTNFAAKTNRIPLRYTILDPKSIVIESTSTFSHHPYKKVLSQYEIQKLKTRKTEEDKRVYNSLDAETKKLINEGSWSEDGIYVSLEADKFHAAFYKKQDYEPFAVPFGYPVLSDIDHKLELKKIDRQISRTIQNVTLLVTMGSDEIPISPDAMIEMQKVFENESVTRVLVADHTTKASFIIPEIGNILDPQKYQVVNQDIRDGLLNIIVGEDKFANQMMKIKVFLERLKEGRKVFLSFLQKEIKQVCKDMGFNTYPIANFEEIDLKDEIQWARIWTRLMELGALTPEQGFNAIKTGVMPEEDEIEEAQQEFLERRKKGFFNPLNNGINIYEGGPQNNNNNGDNRENGKPTSPKDGRPAGSNGTPQSTQNPSPAGTGQSQAKAKRYYSVVGMKDTMVDISKLFSSIEKDLKRKYKLKKLDKRQERLAFDVVASVISSSNKDNWQTNAKHFIEGNEKDFIKNPEVEKEVDDICVNHEVTTYQGAILYHSQTVKP